MHRSAESYVFADCVLDTATVELRRGGELVHVEPQVFALLVHLAAHASRVVPKTELLDEIWGNRFVSESALTSRVKAARRAVGDDGRAQRVIATVHGVGYRLVAPVSVHPHPAGHPTPAAGSEPDPAGAGATDAVPTVSAPLTQQIRYCRSRDGVNLAYAVSGSGPPLLKAANWLTHLDLEWSSPIWSHWLTTLSARRTLVRYDERGCGLSDWPVDTFSLDAWVDDLAAVADSAGLDRFPLLGISQGAAVAISYAVRYPERVTALVLVGGYARGRLARATTDTERDQVALDLQLGRVGWEHDDPSFRQVFASMFQPDASRDQWDAFNDLQRATTSTRNVVRFLDAFAHLDVRADAGAVSCPALVMHSRGDLRVPVSQAVELAGLLPDSRLTFLDSRNHLLTGDEPAWPRLLSELDGFLDEIESGHSD